MDKSCRARETRWKYLNVILLLFCGEITIFLISWWDYHQTPRTPFIDLQLHVRDQAPPDVFGLLVDIRGEMLA